MFSIRDSRIHQRLLICLLLVLLVTTIKPVSAFNPGFSLVSTGSSEISWTDEVKKFDDHAIKLLYTDDQYLYVNLSIPTGVKIKDLAHWDYWSMTDVARFSPSIEFVLEDAATNIWVITLRPIESAITVGQWMNPSSTTSWNYVINTWLNDGYQTDYSSTEQTWSWVTTDFQEAVITGITIGNHRLSVTPVVTAYLDDFTMTAKTETYTYQFEPPAGPPPDIVYVDAAGTCSNQTPCFTTIQAGVDAVADAGVVIVEPGLYTENINIAKPVSLEGANTGNNPNTQERLPESTLDGTFTIGSSNVIVDGFQVIGSGGAFVSSGITDNIQILNNRMIEKTTDQVISSWNESVGSTNWTITDNYIANIQTVGASAIAVKNIQTLSIYGNRIELVNGNGVLFDGTIHNVWIADNILHFLDGDGIHFATHPTGTVQIQGNLFKENMGFGIYAPADINVAYNAWGKPSGPTPGLDLPAVITTYAPFTHAALELKPTSSITANTAVFQSQVTFDIFADLYNVWGAEINIVFPSEHLAVAELGLTSYGVFDFETFALSGQTIFFHGDQRALLDGEDEIPPGGPVQAPVKLFSITFNTLAFGKNLSLEFGEVNFSFAYQDGDVGVSNNVYSSKLAGIDDLQIIDLPQISTNLVNDSLISASGIEETFKITLNNPVEGGAFDHLQVNFMLHNAAAENIFRFEFYDGAEWKDVKLENDSFGNVIGWLDIENGFSIQPNETKQFDIRIVFKDSGSWAMDFFVEDLDTGWTLDQYSFDVEISVGNLIVSGTVFMQGRRERFGVSVSLVSDPSPGLPDHGTMTVTSSNAMENNIWFNLVNAGTYRITTQQPRYLNLSWELNKAITFDTDHTLPMDLWLYAGDANGDNVIDISDASIVGSLYGVGGINDNGDVNFDNRVNIQDLALVGGNYKLNAATAYAGWTP